jgi:hypothetical protein
LNGMAPDQAVKGAADKVQAMLDEYWASVPRAAARETANATAAAGV